MTARSTRRAAERLAKKAARKAEKFQQNAHQLDALPDPAEAPLAAAAPAPEPVEPETEQEDPLRLPTTPAPPVENPNNPPAGIPTPMNTRPASQARVAANRANAQLSTGPRTEPGKAASSQNRLTHGLVYNSDTFRVLPCESQPAFDNLLEALTAEHQPATPSESLLVERMAHHEWLYRRALRLQETCFDPATGAVADVKMFSLYMRYAAAHERGSVLCTRELAKSRKDRQNLAIGFEREKRTQENHPIQLSLKQMEVGYREMRSRQLCREEFGPEACPPQPAALENPPETVPIAA